MTGLPGDATAREVRDHFEALYQLEAPDWEYRGCLGVCCRRRAHSKPVPAGPDFAVYPLAQPGQVGQDGLLAIPATTIRSAGCCRRRRLLGRTTRQAMTYTRALLPAPVDGELLDASPALPPGGALCSGISPTVIAPVPADASLRRPGQKRQVHPLGEAGVAVRSARHNAALSTLGKVGADLPEENTSVARGRWVAEVSIAQHNGKLLRHFLGARKLRERLEHARLLLSKHTIMCVAGIWRRSEQKDER